MNVVMKIPLLYDGLLNGTFKLWTPSSAKCQECKIIAADNPAVKKELFYKDEKRVKKELWQVSNCKTGSDNPAVKKELWKKRWEKKLFLKSEKGALLKM